MTIRVTYEQFTDFVRRHADERSKFKKRWFKLNMHTGIVFVGDNESGQNERDWVWIYDGYFPIYENGLMVGVGNYDGRIRFPLSPPKAPTRLDDVEMVILTDIYGYLDEGD